MIDLSSFWVRVGVCTLLVVIVGIVSTVVLADLLVATVELPWIERFARRRQRRWARRDEQVRDAGRRAQA